MNLSQPPIRDPAFKWPESWSIWFTQIGATASALRQHGPTAKRPTKGLWQGRPYWDEDLGYPVYWNGSQWVDSSGLPI